MEDDRPSYVLVLDDLVAAPQVHDGAPAGATRVAPETLGIAHEDLLRLAMLFPPDALAEALVPALLRTALHGGAEVAAVRGGHVAVGIGAVDALDGWTAALPSLDPGTSPSSARLAARGWVDQLLAAGATATPDAATALIAVLPSERVSGPLTHLPDGTPIDMRMRALYRDALFDDPARAEPPNPFRAGGSDAFVAWLREPTAPDVAPRVGRYLARVWSDSEVLRSEYPELDPESADVFETWCREHGPVPPSLRPTEADAAVHRAARRRARPTAAPTAGVNVVGYTGAVLGLGEVARNLADALTAAGVPVAAVRSPASASLDLYDVVTVAPDAAPHDVNVFVVTADTLPALAGKLGPGFFAERRNIGLWFWEAERFRPGAAEQARAVLDEIWAPSAFVRDALDAAALDAPVTTVPMPVPVPVVPRSVDRRALGLADDRFVFLFMFDHFSVVQRKNPAGVLDAYLRAFAPSDGTTLVLKSINGTERPGDLDALRARAPSRPDVRVWDEYLAPERHAALLGTCDAYVSLHRSEGLGLTMAEAMALGKPVIATGYGGNLEFMTDDVAFLVRSNLVPIGEGVDPYPPDARWAEPDVEHAAELMRRVVADPSTARAVGRRAAEAIRARWSTSTVGAELAALVEQARSRPRDPDAPWRTFFMRGWRNRLLGTLARQYPFDWLADGFPLDASIHHLFGWSVREALENGGRRLPPDPYAPDATARMLQWLNAPVAPRRRPVVSRYLVQYWHDHPELHERFPGIESDREQATAYVDWMRRSWHADTDIDYRLAPGA